jgi:diguanylate cyclase (GGDEF)-like protein
MIKPADILLGKILIVDDKEVNVVLLERTLRGAGYVSVASTTKPGEVCALHRANAYDLILLDLEMPGMDGFAVMEGLKEIETDGYLPVLAVTAHPAHKLRALQCGAKDFLTKPFDLAEVLTRVRNMLEVRLLHREALGQSKALEALALNDPLTGLANRRLFADRMSLALIHARRNRASMAVMYVDLDGFKTINDTLGHAIGDALLQAVAGRLTAAVREEDAVARLGGDEFAIALWNITGPDDADAVASKVNESVSRPYVIEGHPISMTASIGVAFFPNHGDDPEALMKSADAALYEAKRAGKNVHRVSTRPGPSAARPAEAPPGPAPSTDQPPKMAAVAAPAAGGLRLELAPQTIAWIVAALGFVWLIYRLWMIILLVVIALVIVGTFNPIVESMQARGLKRMHALIVLMIAMGLGAALLIFLTVPALIEQLTMIVRDLPANRERLIDVLGQNGLTAPLGRALSGVGLEQASERLRSYIVGHSSDVGSAIGGGITSFSLAFYFLADGKRTQGTLYAIVPRDYHMRLARIIHNLETIVGGYMRGQLITSASLAAFTFSLLVACGVRNALALALLASLLDIFPFVGDALAIGPVVLAALGRGASTASVALVCMFAYQQFENKILVPRIYGRALRLSPATVLLALIAGGALLGMIGALLALPIAAGLQMIVEELGLDMPGDDSDDPTARARDQKTEDAYELMSSGSTAHDAGEIASGLAHDIRDADAWVAARRTKK